MGLHILDIILCLPLIWGLVRGFMRGLIFELAILAAVMLGFLGGFALAGMASVYISKYFSVSGQWLSTISFIIVFIVISMLVLLLGKLLTKVISITGLGILNRMAGSLFGLAKWLLIVGIVLWLFHPFDEKFCIIPETKKESSYLYAPLLSTGHLLAPGIEKIWKSEPLKPGNK